MSEPLLPEGWQPGIAKPLQRELKAEEYEAFAVKVYRTKVRPMLDEEPVGWFLSVDLNSEDYELDENHGKAARRLRERRPDADIFTTRVGFPSAYQFTGIFGDSLVNDIRGGRPVETPCH